MSALAIPYVSPEQYLQIERKASFKSEYWSGQMFAMAGASREHNVIVGNVVSGVHSRLRGKPCETYPSDMRVQVSATGLYTYPDITIVCGEPLFLDAEVDTLLNPLLLVGVLSDSTGAYDRGGKWKNYQRLDSLQEYVLVSQTEPRVEKYVRQPGGQWLYSQVSGLDAVLPLAALDVSLPLSEIYTRVKFPPPEETVSQGAGWAEKD